MEEKEKSHEKKEAPKKTVKKTKKKVVKKKPPTHKKRIGSLNRTHEERVKIKEMLNDWSLALILYEETPEQKKKRLDDEENERVDNIIENLYKKFWMIREKKGRPTKVSEEVVSKVFSWLSIWSNEEEACSYAWISRTTWWRWKTEHPDFCNIAEAMKQKMPLKARSLLNRALDNVDNAPLAFRILYSLRPEEYQKTPAPAESENTVNIVFSHSLGKSAFYNPDALPPHNS